MLVLLKLDFDKAYDKINWGLLFLSFEKMGMAQEFIEMVKMLVQDVKAIIYVNGCMTKKITIERSVRYSCPLSPHLFILVREVLNHMMKRAEH